MPVKKQFKFTVSCDEDAMKALLGEALEKMLGLTQFVPTDFARLAGLPTGQTSVAREAPDEAPRANEQPNEQPTTEPPTVTDEPLLPVSAPAEQTRDEAPVAQDAPADEHTHGTLKLKIREWVFAADGTEAQVARTNQVNGLLLKFRVERLTDIGAERLNEFAAALKELGVGV